MALSFLYRTFTRVLQLVRLSPRKDRDLAVEVGVLRRVVAFASSCINIGDIMTETTAYWTAVIVEPAMGRRQPASGDRRETDPGAWRANRSSVCMRLLGEAVSCRWRAKGGLRERRLKSTP